MKRVRKVSPLYRGLIVAIEIERRAKRWPMYLVDEKSGIADSLYSKMVAVDAPCGRQSEYATLDDVCDALWPDGWSVQIVPGKVLRTEADMKAELAAHSRYDTFSHRYEPIGASASAQAA